MLTVPPHHIIAIGASAGGLEEINSFFDHTPLDGVSYVIVQHLSPDFKSRMVELLAKHSKLKVMEAGDGMAVQSNQVYLIPNDKYMTIHDSKLYLTDKEKVKGPHLTINTFFNSLAIDNGQRSIAVVLSGLGADGSEGVRAIKKAGGMVMVRNPETSNFAGMPSSAIATGVADFVLEPELMPEAIEDYIQHQGELLSVEKEDKKNLEIIINLIKEQSPLDFSDYKQTTILRRIKRRAAYNDFATLEKYLDFLKVTPGEVEALAKDFLISVTSFFRDKEAFDFIQENIIPDILIKLAAGEELKMWVAGCATGEEAYSMAILVAEQLTGDLKNLVVKIFATDIDNVALLHAGKGIYNPAITKDVTEERLENFFTKEKDNYKVNPEIRKMVIFAQHDLVKNPPYCNMHFISCRNLLIYMTQPLQKKIFLMLLFGLKTDRYLFLGSSENPMPIIQNLSVVNKKWKIYKNLETKKVIRFDAFSLPDLQDVKQTSAAFPKSDPSVAKKNTLDEAVNANLVNQMDSLVVCIDESNHVVKTYGDTTKYLLQKNFYLNLTELLPRPLVLAFNTLSIAALKQNKKVIAKGIQIKHNESVITISLSVSPMVIKEGGQKLLMVIFTEDKLIDPVQQNDLVFDEKKYYDEYTVNLEEELKEIKNKLHAAILQVDATNENMQSFNEELLSANEEMQSTNEEMQSVNEELHTINSDYLLKNNELQDVNDDLNNYFRSNVNGQLFVDNDLLLMKFSPGTVKLINLLPTDIGRPLSNISTNIKFETISNDIKRVIEDGVVITKEIETENGKWYQLMTMPYIRANNKSNGAVITFNDITELKNTQGELDKKNESLLRINADLDNFVHTASHDLLGPLSSMQLSIDVMNEIKVTDPRLNMFLDVINTSVKKFGSLINDISVVAKIESGMLAMEMVGLDEIINNIEWSLDNKMKAAGAVIQRDLAVKQLYFSKKNLRSMLYNFISNGIKFKNEEPPVINVSTKKEGDHVILSIHDNGMGISKIDQEKIFDMYGRLHHDIEGHGIGLYLAKKIVDAAGGNIIVESEVGKGSRFDIYFKIKPESEPLLVA